MPQQSFLSQVLAYYYTDNQLSERCFVFPSKRAKAFFLHHLKAKCQAEGRYMFAPQCTTVNDFILGLRPDLQVLDKTELLFNLYDCRVAQRGYIASEEDEQERLDNFLFWGNIILSDFDQIDRNLVDAYQLYRNVEGLKELEDINLDFLNEETKISIEQYFRGFVNTSKMSSEEQDTYRSRYLHFWSSLYELYTMYREGIAHTGKAYEGYIYREAAEDEALIEVLMQRYEGLCREGIKPLVFVGLFDLSESERQLFIRLYKAGLAEFVWDEGVLVAQDEQHPASRLLRRNIQALGSVPITHIQRGKWEAYKPKGELRLYRCASTVTQVKALSQILEDSGILANHQAGCLDTLIVLTDEQMLLPLVSSLPEDFEQLNISLGYPLNRTSVSILINRWLRLLPTAYQGAYAVPSVISLLSLQVLTAHYPALLELCDALRKQNNYMLGGAWIVDKYLPILRKRIVTKAGEEAAKALDAIEPILEILLKPREDALGFLRQLDKLLVMLAEPMIAEEQGGSEESDTGDETEAKTKGGKIGFELVFLMHYQRLTRRLITLLEAKQYGDLSREGAVHLLEGLSRNLSIPFKGDPLQGLQVMGLLESRSLHFDNVIYLMAQEGKLPKKKHHSTFIPNILRYAYKLPTQEYNDAVEAYRFYQSIAQCERLVMITGEEDSLGGKGEESRYIAQLDKLYGVPVKRCSVELRVQALKYQAISIDKHQPEVIQRLESWLSPRAGEEGQKQSYLSPSSLNTYLQCPLKFYYQYIKGLRDEQEVSELLAANDYGSILHDAMASYVYADFKAKVVQAEDLEQILARGKAYLEEQVERAYMNFYNSERLQSEAGYQPKQTLDDMDRYYIQMLAINMQSIIRYDMMHCPFEYIEAEREFAAEIAVPYQGEERAVCFKGIIDRIDKPLGEEGECLRILDYKTGGDKNDAFQSIGDLFANPAKRKAAIQTLVYCELITQGKSPQRQVKPLDLSPYKHLALKPALLITRQLAGQEKDYVPYLKLGTSTKYTELDYKDCREAYLGLVQTYLGELFDLNKPFVQSPNNDPCGYCSFASICHRKSKFKS